MARMSRKELDAISGGYKNGAVDYCLFFIIFLLGSCLVAGLFSRHLCGIFLLITIGAVVLSFPIACLIEIRQGKWNGFE